VPVRAGHLPAGALPRRSYFLPARGHRTLFRSGRTDPWPHHGNGLGAVASRRARGGDRFAVLKRARRRALYHNHCSDARGPTARSPGSIAKCISPTIRFYYEKFLFHNREISASARRRRLLAALARWSAGISGIPEGARHHGSTRRKCSVLSDGPSAGIPAEKRRAWRCAI